MASKEYDAIVIGSGPGGYVASIRLGQLGLKTLCVEKKDVGGVCLNWGCIPSKALIAAAGLVDKVERADEMGISVEGVKVNVKKMQSWKNGIVKKLTGGVSSLVKGSGSDIAMGEAKLTDANTVEVTDADGKKTKYKAKKGIIVSTGTQVIQIPGFEPDGKTVITAKEAVSLEKVPKHMVIIGGGIIGMELGMVYQKLGAKITIVELMDQLLPGIDKDLVKVVEKHLHKREADVFLKSKAKSCEVKKGKAKIVIETPEGDKTLEADKVLVSVGFKPNSKGLGLEEIGVELDERGHIKTDETMQTSVPGVYAIGDVSGTPYLAHKASKEGEIAAEVIAGHPSAADWRAMPAAIFTDPEIATVGMSESEAKASGKNVNIGKFPFAVSGRAMAVSETDGFVKVLSDAENDQVLGVSIVGPEASDMISEAALALEMCAYTQDVALTVHPHPTLSEGIMEAFKHAIGEAVHIKNKKK